MIRPTAYLWALAVVCTVGCQDDNDLGARRLIVAAGRTQVSDIYMVNGHGGIVQRITDTPHRAEIWPIWAPDGVHVYYEARETADRSLSLRVFNLLRGTEKVLYGPVGPGELWCALSPDGTSMAFVAKDSFPGDLVVLDIQTGDVRSLSQPGERLLRPEWAPDSRRLLCQAKAEDRANWELLILDTMTGERRRLSEESDSTEFKGKWSPDGRSVVHSVTPYDDRGRAGLQVVDVETGAATGLRVGDHERVISAAWSSLGVLAAIRERPKPMLLLLWPGAAKSGEERVVTMDEKCDRGRFVWSPDGCFMAMNYRERPRKGRRGEWRMVMYDASGNTVRQWPNRMQMFCPAWAPTTGDEGER
ncbi:PD40 domain-containing protein [Candidatus Fermentibacteria bacterium]|nr:PD40 domain-containing protein [Candidatus Fermentibacteria bacterium]